MTPRLSILGTVLSVALLATSCSLPTDATVKRNTDSIDASTAALQQSLAAMEASTAAMTASTAALQDSTLAVAQSTRQNLEAIETSRQAIEANTAQMAEVGSDLDAVKQQADKALAVASGGALDDVVNELRYSLVLAFMAFGFLVSTVGNDARVKCSELILRHRAAAAGTPEAAAIQQSADDFQNTYRWSLRLCGLIVLFLAVQMVLGHGGRTYWLYLGGVAFTGLVLWNFYRVESQELIGISGGRLGLRRRLAALIVGSRTSSWK